jgi:hypothetical protein
VQIDREISLTRLQILASPPKSLYIVPTVVGVGTAKVLAKSLGRTDIAFAVPNYLSRCYRSIAKRQQTVVIDHTVWNGRLDAMTRTDRQAFQRGYTRLTQLGLIHTP